MNRPEEQQLREAAAHDAAAWLLRLESPDAVEHDWLALQTWLEAAPEHRKAFDRVERVSAELALSASDLLRALDVRQTVSPPPSRRRGARRARAFGRIWTAAGLAAAAAAALMVFVAVQPPTPVSADLYQTAKGEDRVLNLDDGSRIHLNSGSRIAVRLQQKARHVDLTEGEAAFEVTHDPDRPFTVAVGEREIRVVGTEFNVLNHQGRLRVTVRSGVVAVEAPGRAVQAEPVLLHAGDQLDHQPGANVWTVQRVDPEVAFAWRNGDLVYVDQRLDEVVRDLNRYFPTPVRVVGSAANLRFSGVLRIDTEDAVMRRLQAFLPISAEREGEGVTLRQRQAAS
jgi:transmembrane sensor